MKRSKANKQMSPREATRLNDICKLKTDHHGSGDYWIQLDVGFLSIANQQAGSPATKTITIPRRNFNGWVTDSPVTPAGEGTGGGRGKAR